MKVFVVLSCIALAVAKPQGYSYNQPSSFGGSHNFGVSAPSNFGGSHSFGASSPSIGLNTPGTAPAPSFTGSSPSFAGSSPSFSSGSPSFTSGSSLPGGSSFGSAPSFAPSFSGAQPSFQSFASQPAAQQSIIQKHIYVHVPPPQEDEFVQSYNAPVQAQKHYKIIFIKAPSAPSVSAQQLQALAQPQSEEKTLVYVLVKKPESVAELAQNIQPAPVTPSKPEVYFIKYKAQKEQAPSFPVQSGSAEASLPISSSGFSAPSSSYVPAQVSHTANKPSPVYGPAH